MQGVQRLVLAAAVVLVLGPASAFAQEGQIAGTVRDESGGVMPGVLVEVTSPALIEKVRAATTDANGQYRITNLPVGTYSVTFALEGFSRVQRENIGLTSGFTAPVNATMTVGQLADTITVTAEAPTVDVQNARQVTTIQGDEIQDLPTDRNVSSLLRLTPGLTTAYQPGSQTGICSGGVGVFCNPGVAGFNVGGDSDNNLNQGRILVDGQVINSGVQNLIGGMSGGYMADIANAQEVNIQVSGALGESETGGASINIVPRTGGNTFAGNFSATYTEDRFFADNTGGFNQDIGPELGADQIIHDHDVSGAFGGPIKRDMLWFYAVVRDQQGEKRPVGYPNFWPNLHEGKWGFNYQPDRSRPSVTYTNKWRNGNARITYQMTQRNKFNFFWDEQDFCQDPCDGVVSVFTSPESWWSVQRRPNRLIQASWTNPYTNRLLFEAGLSTTQQLYDTSEHRVFRNPQEIPRVVEVGETAGADDVSPRVNEFAGEGFFALTSGSLNSAIASGGAEKRWLDNYQLRASASYVTGTHNAKIGYQGAIYTQETLNQANDPRLTYNYEWPDEDCLEEPLGACGNTSLQFPNDPFNLARRPIPNEVTINTGEGSLNEKVWYAAFYAQDQWTLGRLTVNGAVRFDHAASNYGETCVGPDIYVPLQSNGQNFYCTPSSDGVSYNDITPRWGVAWDVFGTGRTSIKWNMGRYNNAASLNGVYAGANPARRTVNSLARAWTDTDGDRIVDCNLMSTAANGECGAPNATNARRYGRDPLGLDEAGDAIGLTTTQCGRREEGIPEGVQAYCDVYGETLIEGSGKRQGEWQFGLGVQHEILPRLSGEVTYNRRHYRNLTQEDDINTGCDRFLGSQTLEECQAAYLNYRANSHDLYMVTAPVDPRLPGGGGYQVLGLSTSKIFAPNNPSAVTIWDLRNYSWHSVDTNFVWRGPGGLRINGGTSTYRSQEDDTCNQMLDSPDVKHRAGNPIGAGGCLDAEPWQTRINGSAAYVVPWVDVLVSSVFQSFPGVERSANFEYTRDQVTWMPGSEARRFSPCFFGVRGTGCFGSFANSTTTTVDLLDNNELFGERITMIDLKIAKNIRFGNQRATVGVDVYNVFNSDAIQDYNDSFELDDPSTPENEDQWGQPAGLVSPRFVRLSLQFYF